MRRLMAGFLMVLIVGFCGCSDGGVGIAGFGAPSIRAGTYTGTVICVQSSSAAPNQTSSSPITINIGESGLLMIGDTEIFEGMIYGLDLLGLATSFEITSVVQTNNGMTYRSEGLLLADVGEGGSILASGIVSGSLVARDFDSIDVRETTFLTISDPSTGLETVSLVCTGTLFR